MPTPIVCRSLLDYTLSRSTVSAALASAFFVFLAAWREVELLKSLLLEHPGRGKECAVPGRQPGQHRIVCNKKELDLAPRIDVEMGRGDLTADPKLPAMCNRPGVFISAR